MEALKDRVAELELMVGSLVEAVDLLIKDRPKEQKPAPIPAAGIAIGAPFIPSAPKSPAYKCQVCMMTTSDPEAYADQNVQMDTYDRNLGVHLKHSLMQRHYCCGDTDCMRFFYNDWGEKVKLF